MKLSQNTVKSSSTAVIHCFLRQENHHIETSLKKEKLENRKTRGFEAWKYVEPKDLNSLITDEQGRNWKLCTKCVCSYTK
jgi:hypothetical protein